MKAITLIILCLIVHQVYAQETNVKTIKTEANEVTVFLEGAQIVSKKKVELQPGITVLKFTELSPFIDPKSIQVKAEGDITVMAVNHQQNFLDKSQKPAELLNLEKTLESVEEKIRIENTYLSIIQEELAFLQENRDIGGKNQEVSITNLQQASDFYGNRLTALKLKEIERNKTLEDLNKQKLTIQDQIQTISSKKEFPTGEIIVKVNATKNQPYSFELSYLVGNAGWYPSYDIRAKNIGEPVQLIYKANVRQDTKMDWNNVKLKFSTSNPNVSGVAPELQTYYLNYNTLPPAYKLSSGSVSGKVMDSNGEPLPGTNVMVEGTTIGTICDMEGNYSITIPPNADKLTFTFIGYTTQTLPINGSLLNVVLEESNFQLQEVVVTGNGVRDALQGRTAGISSNKAKSGIQIRGVQSLALPTVQVEKQTVVDFEIKMPYTIKSENKTYTVDMEVYELPAQYQYYCVPKIDKDAFLMAHIVDWEKYNLLEGEANVFFEETYVGKTLMDVRNAADTLQISLGRDKKVQVSREKVKDFTTKQFIGNKKEETRDWKTTVKNNKSQEINMIILDQVPVSTLEEIEVTTQQTSNAKYNAENGEMKWEFKLAPNDKKEFELKYSVKYPKYRNLVVE